MTLETCLRLHGRVCPPEMLPFHETLESFFRKNFAPEIQRLAAEGLSEFDYANSISPSTSSHQDLLVSVYPTSIQNHSSQHSISSGSTSRAPYAIPSLQLGGSGLASPSSPSVASPRLSMQDSLSELGRATPLKRHLQHLAKHGLSGVSSTGERTPTEVHSPESPTGSGSFINVMPLPSASMPASAIGSSANSFKSRLSRLGNSIRGRE
jgi:dedicator of cytokinesis protein 3